METSLRKSTLFINCTISGIPKANAILCNEGAIKTIGLSGEIVGDKTIDLRGGIVYPGFTDSHLHLLGIGMSLETLNLANITSPEKIIKKIVEKLKSVHEGQWLQGWGWDQNNWRDTVYPTKEILDAVSPNSPIYLKRIDGHAAWVNSRALTITNITKKTQDPDGGKILRDNYGAPTGILIDSAMELVRRFIPKYSKADKKRMVLRAISQLNSMGITFVHDAGTDLETIELLKNLISEKQLNICIYAMLTNNHEVYDNYLKTGPFFDNKGYLTVRTIKLFLDGALGSRGAALLRPYYDDPKNMGLILIDIQKTIEKVKKFNSAGFQVSIHCIGDRANRIGLNILEAAGERKLRNRIEHAQIIHPNDITRFADIGVIPSMQAIHCTSDMYWINKRLGVDRLNEVCNWQSLLMAGTIIAGGSDAPVESPDPLSGIYAAVTRKDKAGSPTDGWRGHERLTIEQALLMYTQWPAYASFLENTRGKIKPGFQANFTVLSKNLISVQPEDILKTKVLFTIVNGKVVYAE